MSNSVALILREMALAAGAERLRRGQIWGDTVAALGQVPGQVLADQEQARRQAVLDAREQDSYQRRVRADNRDEQAAVAQLHDQQTAHEIIKAYTSGSPNDPTGYNLEAGKAKAKELDAPEWIPKLEDWHAAKVKGLQPVITQQDPTKDTYENGKLTKPGVAAPPQMGTPAYEIYLRQQSLQQPPPASAPPSTSATRPDTTTLSPADEQQFQAWVRAHQITDVDAPESRYDYRAAFKANATPDASGHWPSAFKLAGHPNEVVGGFNTRTGARVPGTPRLGEADLVAQGWDAETAARLAATPEPVGGLGAFGPDGAPVAAPGSYGARTASPAPTPAPMSATAAGLQAYEDQRRATEAATHSPIYKEWQDYKRQGGPLTFNDYQTMDANRKRSLTVNNGPSDTQMIEAAARNILANPRDLTSIKTITTLRGDQRLQLYNRIKALDPTFNVGNIDRQIKFLDAYEDPKGKPAMNRQSMNNILMHASDLSDVNQEYRRVNLRLVNTPLNKLRKQYSTDYEKYATTVAVLKDEIGLYFAGGYAPTKEQGDTWSKILNDDVTPNQIEAFAKQIIHVGLRRASTHNSDFRSVMGYDDPNLLTPDAVAAGVHLGLGDAMKPFGSGGTLGTPPRTPGTPPPAAEPGPGQPGYDPFHLLPPKPQARAAPALGQRGRVNGVAAVWKTVNGVTGWYGNA